MENGVSEVARAWPRFLTAGIQVWEIFVRVILSGRPLFTRTIRYLCFRTVVPAGSINFVTRTVTIHLETLGRVARQPRHQWIRPEEHQDFIELLNTADYDSGHVLYIPLYDP
jgi:hypothetical protein